MMNPHERREHYMLDLNDHISEYQRGYNAEVANIFGAPQAIEYLQGRITTRNKCVTDKKFGVDVGVTYARWEGETQAIRDRIAELEAATEQADFDKGYAEGMTRDLSDLSADTLREIIEVRKGAYKSANSRGFTKAYSEQLAQMEADAERKEREALRTTRDFESGRRESREAPLYLNGSLVDVRDHVNYLRTFDGTLSPFQLGCLSAYEERLQGLEGEQEAEAERLDVAESQPVLRHDCPLCGAPCGHP